MNAKAMDGVVTDVPRVVLRRGATVTGIVVDEKSGKPIAGVKVAASTSAIARTETDASGTYTLHLEPGTGYLAVEGMPLAYRTERNMRNTFDFTAKLGLVTTVPSIRLHLANPLLGRIVGPDGIGIPAVTLSLTAAASEMTTPTITTGDDGSFFIPDISPGLYRLTILHGATRKADDPITVSDTSPTPLSITALASPVVQIRGTVVDSHGRPLERVLMGFLVGRKSSEKGYVIPSIQRLYTDANGQYVITGYDPETDTVEFRAGQAAGYRLATEPKLVSVGPVLSMSPAVMAIQGASVSGKVVEPNGTVVPGAWITCTGARPTRSGRDGTFLIDGLAEGKHQIVVAAQSPWGSMDLDASPSPASVDIVLDRTTDPVPVDTQAGVALLREVALSPDSVSAETRRASVVSIATVNPSLALATARLAKLYVDDRLFADIIAARSKINASDAASWGFGQIQHMSNGSIARQAAIQLSEDLLANDPVKAQQLYLAAKSTLSPGDTYPADDEDISRIIVLGLLLHDASAVPLLKRARSAFVIELIKRQYSPVEAKQTCALTYAPAIALSNPRRASSLFSDIDIAHRLEAVAKISEALHSIRPDIAVAAFWPLRNHRSDYAEAYTTSFSLLLAELYRRDPDFTVREAHAVLDDHSDEPDMLVRIAKLASGKDALFRSAFEDALKGNVSGLLSRTAFEAKSMSAALGTELSTNVENIYARQIANDSEDNLYLPKAVGLPDVYWMRNFDPGFCRCLIENAWNVREPSSRIPTVALWDQSFAITSAMALIDSKRALEMATAITTPASRSTAIVKIGQYLVTPEKYRDGLDYNIWSASPILLPASTQISK